MRTSAQWWAEVKADPVKLADWLRKQYHGEMTASDRIAEMAFVTGGDDHWTLVEIFTQEEKHAGWMKDLLAARGLDVGEHDAEARYWSQVTAAAISPEEKAAIATLAEGMRLERIRVIAEDPEAPADIREVFAKILVEEEWHEQAFAKMTTPEAIERLRPYHNLGRNVLGLEH